MDTIFWFLENFQVAHENSTNCLFYARHYALWETICMFIIGIKLAQKEWGDALELGAHLMQAEPRGWSASSRSRCCGWKLLFFLMPGNLFWFPFQRLSFSICNLIIFTKTLIMFEFLIHFISCLSICCTLNLLCL